MLGTIDFNSIFDVLIYWLKLENNQLGNEQADNAANEIQTTDFYVSNNDLFNNQLK